MDVFAVPISEAGPSIDILVRDLQKTGFSQKRRANAEELKLELEQFNDPKAKPRDSHINQEL